MFNLVSVLPHLNACLNSLSFLFLLAGFYFIRKRQIGSHQLCMKIAFGSSVIFLICYLLYHSLRAYYFHIGPSKFMGTGWIRPVYFAILLTHTVLAALVAPLALVVIIRALTGRFPQHAKLARWTLPVWLYVSFTGVVVYVLLYHLYPHQ